MVANSEEFKASRMNSQLKPNTKKLLLIMAMILFTVVTGQ